MADNATTEVPGVGRVPKREAAIGVAVVGTLIVVYYVRKKNSAAAATTAAAAATSTDQYPPDGTTGNPSDPYSTDPATGQTYGDEATGSGGTYGAYGLNNYGSSGIIGYDASGNPVYAPGYGSTSSTGATSGGPPFSNNSAWAQYAIQTLAASNTSLDVGALTDALGLFVNGQPVDTSQQQMIFDAIAVAGDPPVAGPTGYPPKVQLNGNTGGANPGTCPAGYTFSATKTGATGEIAATGGSGYCEVKKTNGGGGNGGGGNGGSPGPSPAGMTLTAALASSNIVNVSYAYKSLPQSQWSQYGSHTIASATPAGNGWDVGLN